MIDSNMTDRLYNELADLWPIISPPEDYAAETDRVADWLSDAASVLELGAGAGHTLNHMPHIHRCVALDLSPAMLARCDPRVRTHVGDMRDARLNKTFDAVLAHDALEYMVTEDDLRRAIATAAAHLKPGGVFIAATAYVAEDFEPHDVAHDQHTDGDVEVVNVSYVRRHPRGMGVELVMLLIIREDGRLRVEEDRHHCGLHPLASWRRLLAEGGFSIDEEIPGDDGPTWFYCHKR
jgi:SAM-dependent methyltransferase